MQHRPPSGIAVLDVYQNQWALWQVSVDSFNGRLRAANTNAVVRDHFNRDEFESLIGNRQLLVTPRTTAECPAEAITGPDLFDGRDFASDCATWIDVLDGMLLAENGRREEENERRNEAKKAGLPGPFTKLAPLLDVGWPGMPAETEWTSHPESKAEARLEALRLANGCVRLLDYWLEIETARTRKNRAYFNGLGGPEIRLWPSPAPINALVPRLQPSGRLSFTAIDFETANSSRGSICSVGLAKVVDGSIRETKSWLISPPDGGGFDAFNTRIHGISAEDVHGAPDWTSSMRDILEFIGGDVVIAHNAAFDIGALREACRFAGLDWPDLDYTCTLVLARALLDLPVYKLPWVAAALQVPSFDHHEAGADARACALIAIALAGENAAATVAELLFAANVRCGRLESGFWSGSRRGISSTANPRRVLEPGEINSQGPMVGEVVCFTGKISWSREDAREIVVRNGGTANSGKPTKKTTILVTGDYDERTLRPGMTFGSKLARAFVLVEEGQKLEIMTEDDFRQRLEPEEGNRDTTVQLDG